MDKPITVARAEFAEQVVHAVNEAGLPAFVLAEVLKDILGEVEKEAVKQYRNDRQAWDAATRQTEAEKETGGSDG